MSNGRRLERLGLPPDLARLYRAGTAPLRDPDLRALRVELTKTLARNKLGFVPLGREQQRLVERMAMLVGTCAPKRKSPSDPAAMRDMGVRMLLTGQFAGRVLSSRELAAVAALVRLAHRAAQEEVAGPPPPQRSPSIMRDASG
jgi:hypothetical protein